MNFKAALKCKTVTPADHKHTQRCSQTSSLQELYGFYLSYRFIYIHYIISFTIKQLDVIYDL